MTRWLMMTALVAHASWAADGGTCLESSHPQITRAMQEVSTRNEAAKQRALEDAGMVLVPMESEPSECLETRDKGAPGSAVVDRRGLFIRGFAQSEEAVQQPTAIAKDRDGVFHLVQLDVKERETSLPLRRCVPCPGPRCWGSGVPPCDRQSRFGPLPRGGRLGPLLKLSWTEERLQLVDVTPKCGPMPDCPAHP